MKTEIQQTVDYIALQLSQGIILNDNDHSHLIEDNDQAVGDIMYSADYMQNETYETQYIINERADYVGARLLSQGNGPTVWINTNTLLVEGFDGHDRATSSFEDTMGLNEQCEQMFECL